MHNRRKRDASGELKECALPLFESGIEEKIMLVDEPLADKLTGHMHQMCRAMGFSPVPEEKVRKSGRVTTNWTKVAKRMIP